MKKWGIGLLLCAQLLCACANAQTFAAEHAGSAILFDETGALLCEPGAYSEILPLAEGLFAAKAQQGWLVLGSDGEPLLEIGYEDVYAIGGQLYLKKDGLYAVADPSMRLVTQHLYTQIVPNGLGGFLALKTDPNDDRGDGVYLIDESGNETATGTVIVYGLNKFSCERSAAVGSGGKKTGYLAPDGTWAITAQYGYGGPFLENGLAAASVDSGAGVIDEQGNWVVSPKFESVLLSEGNSLIAVCAADGRIGLLNAETREGVCQIESGYVRTKDLADMALVTREGNAELYSVDGSVIAAWKEADGVSVRCAGEFLLLHTDAGDHLLDAQAQPIAGPYAKITPLSDGAFCARTQSGCDLLGPQGELLAQTPFDRIASAGKGLYLAWKDGLCSLIGADGKTIVEPARN